MNHIKCYITKVISNEGVILFQELKPVWSDKKFELKVIAYDILLQSRNTFEIKLYSKNKFETQKSFHYFKVNLIIQEKD